MTKSDSGFSSLVRDLIVLALRSPAGVADLEPAEQDLLIRLARSARLHGRLAADLKRLNVFDQLPRVAREQLDSALIMAEARERVARWELDRIEWAIQGHDVAPIVCLKGIAYALLNLPNSAGRIFADVDLLLREDHLEHFEAILNNRGWMTQQLTPYDDNYYRRWTHELPPLVHAERDVEIDLHHNIVPRTARLKPSSVLLVDKAVQLPGERFSVPASEDLVLHAMTHLMFDSDLADNLRDLVDIDDMLRVFSSDDKLFWDGLLERAEALDLKRPTYYSLRYTAELLNCPVPAGVLQRISNWGPPTAVRWLMDQLVPAALLPPHPEQTIGMVKFGRLLLYIRSHWLRMPPWLLIYHLSVKFYRKRFSHRQDQAGSAQ